jgi:hypothetical protein
MDEEKLPTREEMLGNIFNLIKATPITCAIDYGEIYRRVYGEHKEGYSPDKDIRNGNLLLFIINDLIKSGIFIVGPYYQRPNASGIGSSPAQLLITERGKEVATSGHWLCPQSGPDNYVKKIFEGIEWIGIDIKPVIYEAYSTWYSAHYIAATALIGLSCEFILQDFCNILLEYFPADADIKKINSPAILMLDRISRLEAFFKKNQTVFKIWEKLKVDMGSIFQLYANQIRIIRNRIAHSPGQGLSPEMAYMALQGLADYTHQLDKVVRHIKP